MEKNVNINDFQLKCLYLKELKGVLFQNIINMFVKVFQCNVYE